MNYHSLFLKNYFDKNILVNLGIEFTSLVLVDICIINTLKFNNWNIRQLYLLLNCIDSNLPYLHFQVSIFSLFIWQGAAACQLCLTTSGNVEVSIVVLSVASVADL